MTETRTGFILPCMLRWPRLILRSLAVFFGVLVVAFLLLAWKVSSQPMTSTALTPYVEAAIEKLLPNSQATIAKTLIEWDNVDHSIALHGEQVILRDRQDKIIAEFPTAKMKLSVLALLQGRFFPSELKIDEPQLWFTRRADGTVWFGGEAAGNTAEGPSESLSIWDALRHFTSEITGRGRFLDLAITRAVVSIHDEEIKQDWAIKIPLLALHHGWDELTGQAQIEVDQKGHSSVLDARYAYDFGPKEHGVTIQFREVNPALLAVLQPKLVALTAADLPLTGKVEVTTDRDLNIVKMATQIGGGKGRLVMPSFWDKPRAVESLKVQGTYDRQTHRLDVPVADIDFGGPKLSLKLEGKEPPSGGTPYDLAFTLAVQLSDLPMDQFAAVWPKPIITNARTWLAANLSRGVYKQGDVVLRGKLAWQEPENMLLESGEGKIFASNATVKYIDGMPPVEGVNAEAPFDLDHMDVKLSGGGIGAIKLQPSTIHISDFQKTVQYIDIPLKLSAPVRDVVKLIDARPLGYARAVGLVPDDCDGRVDGMLKLRFPLLNSLPMKDVDISADAQLTNFAIRKLIKGIDLSQGNLALNLDKEGFSLKGPAALNKVPLQISWQSQFSADRGGGGKPYRLATINGTVSDEQWKQLGLDLSGKVKGSTTAALRLMQPNKKETQLSGDIDFRQAAITFSDLAWKKPAGTAATLRFAADMAEGKNIRLKSFELQGADIKASGSGMLDRESYEVLELDVRPFMLGRTNATLHFSQSFGPQGELHFTAEGESFDVSGLTGGKDPARTDPRPKSYSLNLGKLYTSENGFIADIKANATREKEGWRAIELHGRADGGHPLDISLAPQGAIRVFSLTCDDFGKALKGMGFTDTVKDGPIEMKGESTPENPDVIEGTVEIGHFVVAGLPALARLLSAVSPFGFIDFVTGNASFDHLEGRFRWHGDEAELIKIRAAGSVFGINIDGKVNLNNGEANIHGLLVPFSLFNRIIGIIPLLGDVITGGDGGGVLAAAYTVTGTLNDPDIGVNPVSLLTPGFLRNLFFSGDGEEDELPEKATPETDATTTPEPPNASGGEKP
ncbi:MAG: DUF3971 domain-containing protein [Alphaproteobacteria bacterium]|nr:DUF3971 domain-containing protein [Alphaproteobacteria bacterium]